VIKSTTHRALLYWLLLLITTLAAAGGALWLLHREQLRINEQANAAIEAKKIAVNDRAHLIAENIEVLVIDIQSGLMSTLMEAPTDAPVSFLTNWKTANPLVKNVFQSTNDGQIHWGEIDDTLSSWLRTTPWNNPNQTELIFSESKNEDSKETLKLSKELLSEEIAIPQIAKIESNAKQYQSQRSLAKKMSLQNVWSAETEKMAEVSILETHNDIAEMSAIVAADVQKSKIQNDTSGWTPWFDSKKNLHIFGWRICSNSSVLVVELNIQALEKQLAQMLPQIIPQNEIFSLFRADGSIVNQVGSIENNLHESKTISSNSHSIENVKALLSAQILPNWAIRGTFITSDDSIKNGQKFFLTSAVLVVIFVCTILAGGSLLLRQARISEKESLQKTSFVANVSHELKTPLTSIRLHAELLAENRVRDEEQRTHFLNAIGRETQRLTRLVNNVLDFSRLEQGRRKFTLTNVDIIHELNAILDCHAQRIENAGLNLIRNFPEQELSVKTDSDALGQILINLIDNACKYAASGKKLEITLNQTKEKNIKIIVADRGLGIPSSHRKRIFEKFHRVDNSLTTEQGGAGLGLSIAHQLALSLGGDLQYENRDGGGSKFTLTLPNIS